MATTFYAEKGKPKGLTFDVAQKKATHVEFSLMVKPFTLKRTGQPDIFGQPGDYLVVSAEGALGHYTPQQFADKYLFTNSVQSREEFVSDPENQAAARDMCKQISEKMRDNWFNAAELAKRANITVEDATKRIAYAYMFGLLRAMQHETRGEIYKIELKPEDQLKMVELEYEQIGALHEELGKKIATFKAVHGL